MATSAIQIIEQQGLAYLDNFASTLDALQRLYEETGNAEALRCRERMLARYESRPFKGSPASDNNGRAEGSVSMKGDPESDPRLNYFAPEKNLQMMLTEPWFDEVSADKKRFTAGWREQLIRDLMLSEYRDEIARLWAEPGQRLQLKGHVIGALIAAKVIGKKALAVARIIYGTRENTKEAKTLAKYMGDSRKAYYADWIVEHITGQPSKSG